MEVVAHLNHISLRLLRLGDGGSAEFLGVGQNVLQGKNQIGAERRQHQGDNAAPQSFPPNGVDAVGHKENNQRPAGHQVAEDENGTHDHGNAHAQCQGDHRHRKCQQRGSGLLPGQADDQPQSQKAEEQREGAEAIGMEQVNEIVE